MIEYSAKRKGRAKDEKVDPKQMAVAELMAFGWDPVDALLVVGLLKETDEKGDAQHTALVYAANEALDKLYKKRQRQMKGGCVLDEYQKLHPTPGGRSDGRGAKPASGDNTYLRRKLWQGEIEGPASDEEILAAMWDTITQLDANDPKRVDLLDKYDKLKRRQGAGTEDTTIHFYLPRPECDTCPFKGKHVITEPEPEQSKENSDFDEEPEKKPRYIPKVGYSVNGKKLGRPAKRHYKKRKKAEEEPEEED